MSRADDSRFNNPHMFQHNLRFGVSGAERLQKFQSRGKICIGTQQIKRTVNFNYRRHVFFAELLPHILAGKPAKSFDLILR